MILNISESMSGPGDGGPSAGSQSGARSVVSSARTSADDLPPGVSPDWKCPPCKRNRTTRNRNPKARPGLKFLPYVQPNNKDSWCFSCHNYSRGTLRGVSKPDIVTGLKEDTKQAQWDSEIEEYEKALEESDKGRVTKISSRFH